MSNQPVLASEINFEDTLPDPSTEGFESYAHYICEMAQLYGVKPPGRHELDHRDTWVEESIELIPKLVDLLKGLCPEGTQIGDDLHPLWSAFINAFHRQAERLNKRIDVLRPEIEDLRESQDGTEISSHNLELAVDRAQGLSNRVTVFEQYRDYLAREYRLAAGEAWRPYRGTYRSTIETAATIEARDFIRALARKKDEIPDGFRIGFSAPMDETEYDKDEILAVLQELRRRHGDDLILVHPDNKGGDQVAARWCHMENVTDVCCRPEFDKHHRAAPFQRNRDMLDGCEPEFLVVFKAKAWGIQANLLQEAATRNIPVRDAREFLPGSATS